MSLISNVRPLGIALGVTFGSIAAASGQTTHKNCYEQIGCPHSRYFQKSELRQISCQLLRDVRNIVYKQNGYCFNTDAGKKDYSNEACRYQNEANVPLNAFERHNIALVKRVELEQGCR
jgi:hypothetical protein